MVQKMIGVRNVHWCLLVMMISKMITRIHWNLTGSLMPQLIIFLLFSYVLSFRPAPLTFPSFSSLLIRPCLFVSFLSTSIPVISISALSCHPPPSLLFVKMKLNVFSSHASLHHFSPCLASVSIDSHPPWNSFCVLFPLWQEPVKPPRSVVAARKRHPTRGNGGDKGLERIIQGTSKSLPLRSPLLFSWYPRSGPAACNGDYRVKTYYLLKTQNIGGFVLAVLFRPFIASGCWLLYLCNSENKGASANKDHREEGTQESWVGLKRMCR